MRSGVDRVYTGQCRNLGFIVGKMGRTYSVLTCHDLSFKRVSLSGVLRIGCRGHGWNQGDSLRG